MKKTRFIIVVVLLSGCSSWFINERTSEISAIDNTCLENGVWANLNKNFAVDSTLSEELKKGVALIRTEAFPTEIYLFPDNPTELIAVSRDHYALRYVYNPEISDKVLSGFSEELIPEEKKRVLTRLYKELNKFQCDYGIVKSRQLIESIE